MVRAIMDAVFGKRQEPQSQIQPVLGELLYGNVRARVLKVPDGYGGTKFLIDIDEHVPTRGWRSLGILRADQLERVFEMSIQAAAQFSDRMAAS